MSSKLIGAICLLVGCGGCGYLLSVQYRNNIRDYKDLIAALDYMSCDLGFRATPLPQLCKATAEQFNGKIRYIFLNLAEELEAQIAPNVQRCMASTLNRLEWSQGTMYGILMNLGNGLGRFDLSGQLRAIEHTRVRCCEELKRLQDNQTYRVRSYNVFGLCAGAALAILLV